MNKQKTYIKAVNEVEINNKLDKLPESQKKTNKRKVAPGNIRENNK